MCRDPTVRIILLSLVYVFESHLHDIRSATCNGTAVNFFIESLPPSSPLEADLGLLWFQILAMFPLASSGCHWNKDVIFWTTSCVRFCSFYTFVNNKTATIPEIPHPKESTVKAISLNNNLTDDVPGHHPQQSHLTHCSSMCFRY